MTTVRGGAFRNISFRARAPGADERETVATGLRRARMALDLAFDAAGPVDRRSAVGRYRAARDATYCCACHVC
jgi:hypothetical protein